MGTQLEISIGIYTDGVYVDKLLSENLYLDAWQSDTVLCVCRIFMAVYSVNWTCWLLQHTQDGQWEACSHCPASIPISINGCLLKNLLLSGTSWCSWCITAEYKYLAKIVVGVPVVDIDVVVKFGMKYHVNAHNHKPLAERGLAPELHFFTPFVCGIYLVVKDYINNQPDTKSFSRPKQINYCTTKILFFGGLRI